MSFDGYKTEIKQGDTVILYLTVNHIYPVKAEAKVLNKKGHLVDNVFQTPYGALKCVDLIGKKFGAKVSLSKGWAYALQPTPELWTITLPHRTQIIYTPDVSMILLQLDLKPGCFVIESGTGSGSLSHAIIRAIKPHGHLYTFDFHEIRAQTATEEFKNHGLSGYVTVNHRDVCENGFSEELDDKADAVFLDLPHPWLAVPHTIKSIKSSGGRICSFSPCIEQVQKTCMILNNLSFQDIHTTEVLRTQYGVQQRSIPVMDLDFVKVEKNGEEGKKKEREVIKVTTAVPPASLPGHTGYITFGTLPPVWARNLKINLGNEEDGKCEEEK